MIMYPMSGGGVGFIMIDLVEISVWISAGNRRKINFFQLLLKEHFHYYSKQKIIHINNSILIDFYKYI